MKRTECLRYISSHLTREAVVANLGTNAVDLEWTGDRDENFYMSGGMGLTASVGLGVALAQPDRRVIVLDGDGSLLMNLGVLPLIADQAPRNLIHIVLDNEMWAETGRQPTMTARAADLEGVARASGVRNAVTVRNVEAFQDAFSRAMREDGPWFIVAKIEETGKSGKSLQTPPDLLPHRFVRAMAR